MDGLNHDFVLPAAVAAKTVAGYSLRAWMFREVFVIRLYMMDVLESLNVRRRYPNTNLQAPTMASNQRTSTTCVQRLARVYPPSNISFETCGVYHYRRL